MNDREVLTFKMFNRVLDFGAIYINFFPLSTFGSEQFALVTKSVNELAVYSVTQISGNKASLQGTATKADLREELRDDLTALIRTARSVGRQKPNIDEKFRMPRGNNDQLLIGTARALAAEAALFAEDFAHREMPTGFLEEFGKKISMFEKTISDQNRGTAAQVNATAAIDEAIERGMEAVRDLDAVVRNKFRDDPNVLAEWTSASHIERPPSPAVKKETPDVAKN